MTTTQRSESMNSVVKRYVSYKHNFLQFFSHFQRLIDNGRYRELRADFVANTSTPSLVSPVEILKHAASIYTPEVFKCFQDQWNRSHDCSFQVCEEKDTITKYEITPFGKHYSHVVIQDSSNNKFKCSCSKYEFAGILCAHVLKVFTFKCVFKIPSQYILKRWTRKAKTGYLDNKSFDYNESQDTEASSRMRYRDLSALTLRLATRAAERKDTSRIVKEHLLDLLEKIDEILQDKEVVQCTETNIFANDKVKGVKLRSKPTSGKRLKGVLERISKKRTYTKKNKNATTTFGSQPMAISNTQELEGCSQSHVVPYSQMQPLSVAINPTMSMTDLLMAQQSSGF